MAQIEATAKGDPAMLENQSGKRLINPENCITESPAIMEPPTMKMRRLSIMREVISPMPEVIRKWRHTQYAPITAAASGRRCNRRHKGVTCNSCDAIRPIRRQSRLLPMKARLGGGNPGAKVPSRPATATPIPSARCRLRLCCPVKPTLSIDLLAVTYGTVSSGQTSAVIRNGSATLSYFHAGTAMAGNDNNRCQQLRRFEG